MEQGMTFCHKRTKRMQMIRSWLENKGASFEGMQPKEQSTYLKKLAKEAREEGIYSPSTVNLDIMVVLRKQINILKGTQ